MEKKINVAELLKDCPKGMELDCTMFDRVFLEEIIDDEDLDCTILIKTKEGETWNLTSTGCWDDSPSAKCVIFPKGKTTWEGFYRPFKDGDIVATKNGSWIGITEGGEKGIFIPTYCIIKSGGVFEVYFDRKEKWAFDRLATKEERQKLFQIIKDNGYKWNAETKTLEKLIEPKFKVGDNIRIKGTSAIYVVTEIREDCYMLDDKDSSLLFKAQDQWELVPNKFDITTLVPYESRVLARYCKDSKWIPTFWGSYDKEDPEYPYNCCGMLFAQCIPYEGNEHLLGKTDDCDEYYKSWK